MVEETKAAYLDASLPIDERVKDLLARMTLDEKVAQLGSVEPFEDMAFAEESTFSRIENGIGQITRLGGGANLEPVAVAELANRIQTFLVEKTRLSIPAMVHEECCSGYMALGGSRFPQIIGIASTWEPDLVEQMTTVIRAQMRSVGIHQGLSPVLDVARDPRWGRTEETFGEDPYLISRMGVSYIKGLQGPDLKQGVVATGKHFVGYSMSDGGLNWAPVRLMPRELREVFLTPFEAVVKEAKIASIMNAYHEFDGVPCGCSKQLLTEILRNEWGFDGIVVSDYHTVPTLARYHNVAADRDDAAAMALEAGLDLELPHTSCYGKPLLKALQDGMVSGALIDRAVERILKMKFALGLFENPYVNSERVPEFFDTPEQRSLACHIARKSIVLLKNKDHLLPLKKNLSSIAVIGPNADDVRNLLGDYSHASHIEVIMEMQGKPVPDNICASMTSVLESIRQKVSPNTTVHYAKGCDVNSDSKDGFAEAVEIAKQSEVAILVVGGKSGLAMSCTSGEFRDRASLGLPGVQQQLVEAVCATGTPVVVVLINGRPLSISWIAEHIPAIVEAWLPGEEGGTAVAEVLFGDCNPGGKLPITIPRSVGQVPIFYNHKPSGCRSVPYGDYVDSSSTPLFAFGHGLSYTKFEYDNLQISPKEAKPGKKVAISADVMNVGDRAGDEIVQLYVHDVLSRITRPVMELKGFKRLTLEPGEKRTVTFTLFINQLGFYNEKMKYVVEPGTIEVMLGSASDDIRQRGEFEITGKTTNISKKKVFFSEATVA